MQQEYHLPAGDFPSVEHFREVLGGYNIDKFEKLKPKMIQAVDDMLGYDIPDLLKKFRNPYEWNHKWYLKNCMKFESSWISGSCYVFESILAFSEF